MHILKYSHVRLGTRTICMNQSGGSNYALIITRRTRNAPSTWKLWNVAPYGICRLSANYSDFWCMACYRRDIFFTSATSFLLPSSFLPSFLLFYLTSSCHPHTQLPDTDPRWVSCIGEGEKGENQSRHERGERENEKRSTRVINFHEGRVALRTVFVPQENYRLSADSSESSTCFKLPVRPYVAPLA